MSSLRPESGMNTAPSPAAGSLAAPHILIVTASRQAHHPFLRELTAPPSVLGSHYVVVTMTADQAALDADEPFTLIIVDYAHGFAPVIATLRAAAPQTALLIVVRPGGPQPPAEGTAHQLTTTAQLRSAVAQILTTASS
jgi:hypothetical protein